MSHSAATMEPPCESPAAATAPPPLAAHPGINPTSLIAPFFEPRPGRGLMPEMSFADYTLIPAANASLLKEATPFEQITKLIALHGLPPEAIRFLELTGDSAADAVGMADDLRPVTVPRTFVLPGMALATGEKPTPAQAALIAQVRDAGQAVDAREFNAGTLGRCADKGWVRTEMHEVQESALSESVKDSRAKALAIGDAVHKAILEPEFFATDTWHQHWQLSPTKSLVSERALAAQAEDPARRLITPEIVDTARRCRDAVWKVKKAAWYLTQPGANEVSAEAWDAEMGIWRKCRFDRLPHAPTDGILDVKTTRSRLILSQLRNEAIKYGYGLQLGFYLDTLAMLEGSPRSRSHIIWVTNEAPFIARITELNEVLPEISMTQRGRDIYQERLAAFVLSWHEQQWDAYENEDPIPLLTL